VEYYSPFWAPRAISTINDPRGPFTCRSSTLAVLADSGPFRGLLLTVLRSRSDFHDCRSPGCVDVSVINTRSFGRFWSVSWTITHRFGVSERFSLLRNPKVRLCVIHPQLPFWPILARFMGYYLPFWSILTHFVDYYSSFWGPGAIFMVAEPNVSSRVVHQHSPFWPILA